MAFRIRPQVTSGGIETPVRDKQYLGWVRLQPCLICRRQPSEYSPIEAAHTGAHPYGQKASDYTCVPLCHGCHQSARESYHRLGERAWLAFHGLDLIEALGALHAGFYAARGRLPRMS